MPINQELWKISDPVTKVVPSSLDSEQQLEDILEKHIEIIDENWLVIGRQVPTSFNQYIDLLAITISGEIVIIELKKNRTPRDVVAQAIDYASWVKDLEAETISTIFERYDEKHLHSNKNLDTQFFEKFSAHLEEDDVNSDHQIIIVASELDSSTERITRYLNDVAVPINVIFFKVFEDGGSKYLSRAWLIDPYDVATITKPSREKEPWNGEFYVSFGHDETKSWEDAKQLGFISAGGGLWYSRTLNMLSEGDRVWVNVPRVGYVGVGIVKDTARKITEVKFGDNNSRIYEISDRANYHTEDDDKIEYVVPVQWQKAVDIKDAVSEVGFFGNQNSVAKPTTPKWSHTVNRLKEIWGIE